MLHRHQNATRARIEARLAAELAAEVGVLAAWGFGSFFRGEPFEDIDVAVLLRPGEPTDPRFVDRLAARLERRTGHPRIEVDAKSLSSAPVRFQHAVLRDGRLLTCRDDAARSRYEAETLGRYLDYLPVLTFFDGLVRDRLAEVAHGR